MPGRSQSRGMEAHGSSGAPGQAPPARCRCCPQALETPEITGHSRVQRTTAWDSGSSLTLGSLSPSPGPSPGSSPAARVSLRRCLEPSSTVRTPPESSATIHLLICSPSPQLSPAPVPLAASPLTTDSRTAQLSSHSPPPSTPSNPTSPRALSCSSLQDSASLPRTQGSVEQFERRPSATMQALQGLWCHTHRAAPLGPPAL